MLNDSILLRDSKDRSANPPTIRVNSQSWSFFLDSLKESSATKPA